MKSSMFTCVLASAFGLLSLAGCGAPDQKHVNAQVKDGPSKYLSRERVRELVVEAGFEGSEIETMVCIAYAESSFDAWAESYAGARGLFQIMPFHIGELCPNMSVDDLWNPRMNAKCAMKVYLAQGFDAWDPYYFARIDPSSVHAQNYLYCMDGGKF